VYDAKNVCYSVQRTKYVSFFWYSYYILKLYKIVKHSLESIIVHEPYLSSTYATQLNKKHNVHIHSNKYMHVSRFTPGEG
jgi:hypothetical protein